MGDFRERLAMQWERLKVMWYIPLAELTLMDLASLAGLVYLVHLVYRFVVNVMEAHQRRQEWKKATKGKL